jgi:ribosomal-protein-alanine N-acetyltransferase
MSALFSAPPAPDICIRPLRVEDIDNVAGIESDVYDFPWTAGNFRDALAAGYRCWGCWGHNGAGEELIGYAILMLAVDEAHLLNLAVSRRWRRCGVGRQLLQFVMAEARKQNCVMFYLEVRPTNIAALQLYGNAGFRQMGTRRDYYPAAGGREDALFLGLELF